MNKTWLIGGGVVLALAVALFFKESGQQGGPGGGRGPGEIPVEVHLVQAELIQVHAEGVGTAYANESVDITANVSDTIESIHFEDAQKVKTGDITFFLQETEFIACRLHPLTFQTEGQNPHL